MKRTNLSKDVNEPTRCIIEISNSVVPNNPVAFTKNSAAVQLGRLGGLKGGKARAKILTPAQRSEIAKKAAESRWKKNR